MPAGLKVVPSLRPEVVFLLVRIEPQVEQFVEVGALHAVAEGVEQYARQVDAGDLRRHRDVSRLALVVGVADLGDDQWLVAGEPPPAGDAGRQVGLHPVAAVLRFPPAGIGMDVAEVGMGGQVTQLRAVVVVGHRQAHERDGVPGGIGAHGPPQVLLVLRRPLRRPVVQVDLVGPFERLDGILQLGRGRQHLLERAAGDQQRLDARAAEVVQPFVVDRPGRVDQPVAHMAHTELHQRVLQVLRMVVDRPLVVRVDVDADGVDEGVGGGRLDGSSGEREGGAGQRGDGE